MQYSGGKIGLILKENPEHLRGFAIIKKATEPESAPGLQNTRDGDEIIAIGDHSLRKLSFDQVLAELARVQTPSFEGKNDMFRSPVL